MRVPYKVAVESIIDDYDGQERKDRLMRLQGGAPYRYLLRNVYPKLRVAICKVEYHVKNFNVGGGQRDYESAAAKFES